MNGTMKRTYSCDERIGRKRVRFKSADRGPPPNYDITIHQKSDGDRNNSGSKRRHEAATKRRRVNTRTATNNKT
jgi:hypothetical protein